MTLDYIFYSTNLELLSFQIIKPKEERLFLGCGKNQLNTAPQGQRETVSYMENEKSCHLSISQKFKKAKDASDHFPLYATFKFK